MRDANWECPHCFCKDRHDERCYLSHFDHAPAAPTVHSNGTGWKDLYEGMERSVNALNAAMETMQREAPNGRDYYVQSPDAIYIAQDQHWDRLKRLAMVKAELEAIWMRISDQEPKRR